MELAMRRLLVTLCLLAVLVMGMACSNRKTVSNEWDFNLKKHFPEGSRLLLSPDGKWLSAFDEPRRKIFLFSHTGIRKSIQLDRTTSPDTLREMAWSGDSKFLMITVTSIISSDHLNGADTRRYVYEPNSAKQEILRTLKVKYIKSSKDKLCPIAISNDNNWLMAYKFKDYDNSSPSFIGTYLLYNLENLRSRKPEIPSNLQSIAWVDERHIIGVQNEEVSKYRVID